MLYKMLGYLKDTYRHKGMRRRLINSLREKGIYDEEILAAINAIPRHFFLDGAFEEWAYEDKPFPISNGQTISQPYTVAFQTELLGLQPREKVLEVGTGTGYQAAILAQLGGRVYSVERHETLYLKAKQMLTALSPGNIRTYFRDGSKGLPEFAPFDKILVTAGAEEVPEILKQQLAIGGLMVIPVGSRQSQEMLRIKRTAAHTFDTEVLGKFRFVPFLTGLERE